MLFGRVVEAGLEEAAEDFGEAGAHAALERFDGRQRLELHMLGAEPRQRMAGLGAKFRAVQKRCEAQLVVDALQRGVPEEALAAGLESGQIVRTGAEREQENEVRQGDADAAVFRQRTIGHGRIGRDPLEIADAGRLLVDPDDHPP
ncbi:MAG: hypothetical protein ACHRHE_08875, partial [Tepidisphaerales bacterium]